MLKGRMAETLVEELLKASGNRVYRFGYESTIQNLAELNENVERESDIGMKIRSIPDFIVVDRQGEIDFVEVKFRWSSKFHENDRKMINVIRNFWKAKIILVNRLELPYFRIISPPYYKQNGSLIWKPLHLEEKWNVNEDIYKEYEKLVHKYLVNSN